MSVTEYDGVIINKVTLAKYKELKAAGSIVASQTYVITDLDDYLKDEVFNTNDLNKTTFDTGTQNTDGSFMIQIFKDEDYSTLYTTLSIDFNELEKDKTFELPYTGWYLVRIGLNGDVIDDKLDIWKYFDRCAYSLNVKLVSNILNHCEIENVSITKTHKLPQRLASNSYYSKKYENGIDKAETGFYMWECWEDEYKPISSDTYYYVFSNVALNDDTNLRYGVQIAIAEGSQLMYFRRLTDNQVWSKWKRVLDTDDNLYWQLREGNAIPVDGLLFFNQNTIDLSSLPLDTILVTLTGQNGTVVNLKLVNDNSTYKLNAVVVANGSIQTLASGNSLESMSFTLEYMRVLSTSYGYFMKITYMQDDVLDIVDNMIRINNTNF